MSSQEKINASRENGKKGGPKTDSGRARSSMNAWKHGLYSEKAPLIPTENGPRWEQFRQSILDARQPASSEEESIVERIARTLWRLDRYDVAQDFFLAFEINTQAPLLEKDNPGMQLDGDLRMSLALHHCLSTENSALNEVLRTLSRLHRDLVRLYHTLKELQGPRFNLQSPQQPPQQPQEPEPDPTPAPAPALAPAEPPQENQDKNRGNEPATPTESTPRFLPKFPAVSHAGFLAHPLRTVPGRIVVPETPLKAMTA
jgi:hypothetical protein